MPNPEKEKLGNILIYLTDKLGPTYLTKIIKLLYLLDETAVKETGVPVTWMEYKVWKRGPVPSDLYNTLRREQIVTPERGYGFHMGRWTDKYVTVEEVKNPANESSISLTIKPAADFVDDEFSDYEIELLDRVIDKYGQYSGNDLINILHEEGTLWDQIVREKNLEEIFALESDTSKHTIPFTDLISGDELKELSYKSAFDSQNLSHNL